MEFNKELRPKVGFGVYCLNNKHQVFLMKRQGSHGEGTWCPPGGHIEYGESFLDAASREAKEEADLSIEGIEVLGVTNDVFQEEEKHYATIAVLALKWTGEPKIMEPQKCMDIGWFDLDKLPQPLFLPVRNFFGSNPFCLCGSGKKFLRCHGKNV